MLYVEKENMSNSEIFSALCRLSDSLPEGDRKNAVELALSLVEDYVLCQHEGSVEEYVLNYLTQEEEED